MPKKKAIDNKRRESSLRHNPFDCLKNLVDCRELALPCPVPEPSRINEMSDPDLQQEEQAFLEAMEGVAPIEHVHAVVQTVNAKPTEYSIPGAESEALSRLVKLVDQGEGFVVSDTPEYIEGTGYNVNREFAQRLHRGDFSIQGHIDLHGLNVEAAAEVFESFLKASIKSGKRAVLVIHGRGLSSPGEAVLKNKVRELLSQSYWLKWVIAYTSAQMHDGGAGATYILLRRRPVSKKSGKKGRPEKPMEKGILFSR